MRKQRRRMGISCTNILEIWLGKGWPDMVGYDPASHGRSMLAMAGPQSKPPLSPATTLSNPPLEARSGENILCFDEFMLKVVKTLSVLEG